MNAKKGIIVSIFYDEKAQKMSFVISNNHELINRQKVYEIKEMHIPWI